MIRIITDSSSDFDPETAARLQVEVIPIHINFGEEEFLDRLTLGVEEFYQKLETVDKLPTTSQITPFQFRQVFEPFVAAGDEIVGIFLSSRLSGTFQSAQTAAQMLENKRIHLVDSLNAALGQHLLVQIAVRLRERGLSAAALAETLTALTKRVQLIACVKTMKYLRMGGRVSAATAKIGGVLGITPMVAVEDGRVEAVGKVRGHKAAYRWMQQYLNAVPADDAYPVVFAHSVNPQGRDEMVEALSPQLGGEHLFCDLGCTVGTHIGPGAIGVAYIAR